MVCIASLQKLDSLSNWRRILSLRHLSLVFDSPSGGPNTQAIPGSKPNWQKNTLRDFGKRKITTRPHGFLESHGLKEYFHQPCLDESTGRFEPFEIMEDQIHPVLVGLKSATGPSVAQVILMHN